MKICVVKLSAMGDIIHSMVALQFIKKQHPDCQIDWIVEECFQDILKNNPHIDNILPVNLKSIKKKKLEIFNQLKLLNSYSENNYDIVIDAQGLIKSAIVSYIVGGRVVGSKIVGFNKYSIREGLASWFYDETVNIGYDKNVIDRNIKVLCSLLRVEVSKENIENKEPFLFFNKYEEFNYDGFITFVVGASRLNKIYPKNKFLEIAQSLDEKIVVVWGNDSEKEIASYLESNCDNVTISPKSNLEQLKYLISTTKLVVGADTGPTHMAWALNVPSITIFGNTPENRNTYITNINKVIKSDSNVDALKLDYSDFSIQDINSEEIVMMIREVLRC